MSGGWAGSNRRGRLPANWPQIVAAVHARSGGKCEVWSKSRNRRCGRPADGGVDHVTPNDDDSMDNLQDTCRWHHRAKTAQEGNAAKAAKKDFGKLPPEPHPGLRKRRTT